MSEHEHEHPIRDDLYCTDDPDPLHFREWMCRTLIGAEEFNQEEVARGVAHLAGHDWMVPSLATCCALMGRFLLPPGVPVEKALDNLSTAKNSQLRAVPWASMLEMIVRASVHGDWDMVYDTLAAAAHSLSIEARISLAYSLYGSTARAIAHHPSATGRVMGLYTLFGGQVVGPKRLRALELVVNLSNVACTLDMEAVADEAFQLMHGSPELVANAMALAVTTLGGLVDLTHGPTVITTGGDGQETSLGAVDWADESLDGQRPEDQLYTCWALRAAVAVGRGGGDAIHPMVKPWIAKGAMQVHRYLTMTTLHACMQIASITLDLERDTADGGPPPGHPG